MARISLDQLDEFAVDFLDTVVDGEIPVWDDLNKEFKPEPQATEVIVFRRVFLLMGG